MPTRHHLVPLATLTAAACLVLAACSDDGGGPTAPDPASPQTVTAPDGEAATWSDWVSYGPDERQRYVMLPGEQGGGVAVLVHGGSWVGGTAGAYVDPASPLNALVRALHDDGWWVAAVEYRYADRAPWPATADDVHAATRHAVRAAREQGADDRLLLAGDSAGGHLAALEGTTHPREVDVVAAYYGLHDFTTSAGQRTARGCPQMDVGAPNVFGTEPTTPQQLERARAASPVHRVTPDSPPMVLLHGQDDCIVPPEQSQQMHDALADAHVPVELVSLPGQGHGGPAFTDGTTLPAVLDFVDEHAPAGGSSSGAAG